jgi:hypothetical protein
MSWNWSDRITEQNRDFHFRHWRLRSDMMGLASMALTAVFTLGVPERGGREKKAR